MMQVVQLLGTKDKTDFVLYLAHTLTSADKRVLVVDATKNEQYRYGYVRQENETLYNIQEVDIMCGCRNWDDVVEKLAIVHVKATDYDCIVIDADCIEKLLLNWPKPAMTLYISDSDRFNLMQDIEYLQCYLDTCDMLELRQIHFESAYKLPHDYLQLLMHNRISFSGNSKVLEYDELQGKLRCMMQHDQVIPYSKLPKKYKLFLNELACELFQDLNMRDLQNTARTSLFGFHRKQSQNNLNEQVAGRYIWGK